MGGNDDIWVSKELTEEWDLVAGNVTGNMEEVGVGIDMLEQWEWSTVGCKCDIWGWGWCDCGSESELLSELLSASDWIPELWLLGLRSSDGKLWASVEYGMLVAIIFCEDGIVYRPSTTFSEGWYDSRWTESPFPSLHVSLNKILFWHLRPGKFHNGITAIQPSMLEWSKNPNIC